MVSSSARTPQPAAGRLDRIYEAEQNVADKHREFQGQQLEFLYPENLVSNLTPGFPNLGAPIALILGALAVGSEYGWTTFKTVLTQRPGRLGLYFGKLLALGIVLALLVVLIFAAGAASGYVVGGLEDAPVGWPAAGELARALGAGGLILAIWAALGVLLPRFSGARRGCAASQHASALAFSKSARAFAHANADKRSPKGVAC